MVSFAIKEAGRILKTIKISNRRNGYARFSHLESVQLSVEDSLFLLAFFFSFGTQMSSGQNQLSQSNSSPKIVGWDWQLRHWKKREIQLMPGCHWAQSSMQSCYFSKTLLCSIILHTLDVILNIYFKHDLLLWWCRFAGAEEVQGLEQSLWYEDLTLHLCQLLKTLDYFPKLINL